VGEGGKKRGKETRNAGGTDPKIVTEQQKNGKN
jgi:hypothetical protein